MKLLHEIVVIPLSAPDALKSKGISSTNFCHLFCDDGCLGIDLPQGILLYGVKGVGKSLLAQAVANTSGAHVINITSQQMLLWYSNLQMKLISLVLLLLSY